MFYKRTIFIAAAMSLLAGFLSTMASAQPRFDERHSSVTFAKRNLGGPRLGLTFVAGSNNLWDELDKKRMGRMMSQFGWHFEYQVIPDGGGPQFVVQFVPLVAGVEYGKFVPSGTLAMGVRFPSGIEFGLGPNVMAISKNISKTSLVTAIGKSFNYGGVSIPLNLVCTTNPDGTRFSVIIGYAIAKAK